MSAARAYRQILVCLAAACACDGVPGGDDLVVTETATNQPAESVRFAFPRRALTSRYDLGAIFDQQLFGRNSNNSRVQLVNGQFVVQQITVIESHDTLARLAERREIGEARIGVLDRVCSLSEDQREVLVLAIESDLHRLAFEIDAVRQTYDGRILEGPRQDIDHEQLDKVRTDATACRKQMDHLFHSGSLLGMVSVGILTPSQAAAYRDWVARRRAIRWDAMVRTVLGQFDESVLGLSVEQHAALLTRLGEDVPPLVVFDDMLASSSNSRTITFQMMLVTAWLGRLEKASLRPLFDPRQWDALEQLMHRNGGFLTVQQLLRDQGFLEEDGK